MQGGLVLRDVIDDDLPTFFEQQLDPAANYMAAFTGRDPSDRDAFMAHWARIRNNPSVIMKTILFKGQVAGSVASYIDEEFGKPEVTYWIGKEYWGQGIATRALAKLLTYQKARPIYGRAAKDNTATVRVLEKCGFKIIGYDRGFANARREEIEEVIMELR